MSNYNIILLITDFKKGGGFIIHYMYFLYMFTYSVNCGPILNILFLFNIKIRKLIAIMEQIEFRDVIKFLTKQGKTEQMSVYGDRCPSKTMVYFKTRQSIH